LFTAAAKFDHNVITGGRSISRIGILGGTFNPVHYGHLRAAEEIRELFNLEKVLFITAARPPHKHPYPVIPFEQRHHLVTLAIYEEPYFVALDIENQRPGRSYSVETIKDLRKEYGSEAEFYFIAGLDAFLEIPTWKNFLELFGETAFVVLSRPGYKPQDLGLVIQESLSSEYRFSESKEAYIHQDLKTIYYREVTHLDISSTRIRQYVRQKRSIRFLVPPSVEKYIWGKGLYAA
jgi:nicotinate-nucleotide adenylyltransferase